MEETLTIGQLAGRFGLNTSAIRYYERVGVLPQPERESGQRRYGEDAINRGLSDLNWVSRAAVAHEAVIEAFIAAPAVLPMKLFTIFASDDRAREHMRRDARRIDALIRRVANHQEWGLRVVLDRASGGPNAIVRARPAKTKTDGAGQSFLKRKKAERALRSKLNRKEKPPPPLPEKSPPEPATWPRRKSKH